MNIFMLHEDPAIAATWHIDKHVVKMVVEYAQLLSTAQRLIDGTHTMCNLNGTLKSMYLLPGDRIVNTKSRLNYESDDPTPYKQAYVNHPSAIWVRESSANYGWLYKLFQELSAEFQFRYGHSHLTWDVLGEVLAKPPNFIKTSPMTELPQAMDDVYKIPGQPVEAYRNFYRHAKRPFASWTKRPVPTWFNSGECK